MKTVFLGIVILLLSFISTAQQVVVDYSGLLAGRSFTIANNDSVLVVQNVVPGKGNAIKLSIKGKKINGVVTQLTESERVHFDLVKIFKNQPPVAGKLFLAEDESIDFSVGQKLAVEKNEAPSSGMTYTGIAYWDALAIFRHVQSATYNEDS